MLFSFGQKCLIFLKCGLWSSTRHNLIDTGQRFESRGFHSCGRFQVTSFHTGEDY